MRNKFSFHGQMDRTQILGFQLHEETGLVKAVQIRLLATALISKWLWT